ncbi:hypothetical protein FB45DRAFT_97096 [Roridomyces roridus]|uniref:Uncharacterized protein n=1 Tax=Roridomyces roridus TaxID=1738132 RepID=A0AAD7BJE8_9AGAR|nr:hypothetical protein FB45DRAFT_97096 [Roridomyces roridus]
MNILLIIHAILAFLVAPFVKAWRASALVVLIINADLAVFRQAVASLLDVNAAQSAYIRHLEEKIHSGEQERSRFLNCDWAGVMYVLERIAVIEAQARNAEMELSNDLAHKEEELDTVCKAHAAAQARIAALESTLSKGTFVHESHIHALVVSNLALLKVTRAQDEEIKLLHSQVVDLKDAAIARQEEQEADAQRDAERMKMKTSKIQALAKQLKMSGRVEKARKHARRQVNTAQANKIIELQNVVVALKGQLAGEEKKAKNLRRKLATVESTANGAIATKNAREVEVVALRGEIEIMKAQVAEGVLNTIVRQLATTEQLSELEKRTKEAEEWVKILERERAENSVKVHQTICRLASVHAKQLADLETLKMNVDPPAPATVTGKRTCESFDFSTRYVDRRRRTGGRRPAEEEERKPKRVRW